MLPVKKMVKHGFALLTFASSRIMHLQNYWFMYAKEPLTDFKF